MKRFLSWFNLFLKEISLKTFTNETDKDYILEEQDNGDI